MEGESSSSSKTLCCTIVAMDGSSINSICYRVCATCERPLPDHGNCKFCDFNNVFNPGSSGSKRLYRVLFSVASDDKVMVVICFDKSARALFGCSSDEFFDFAKVNPFAVATAGKILEGEMVRMTLCKPKSGAAQHTRVASVVPLRSGFRPVIDTLREVYARGTGPSS